LWRAADDRGRKGDRRPVDRCRRPHRGACVRPDSGRSGPEGQGCRAGSHRRPARSRRIAGYRPQDQPIGGLRRRSVCRLTGPHRRPAASTPHSSAQAGRTRDPRARTGSSFARAGHLSHSRFTTGRRSDPGCWRRSRRGPASGERTFDGQRETTGPSRCVLRASAVESALQPPRPHILGKRRTYKLRQDW